MKKFGGILLIIVAVLLVIATLTNLTSLISNLIGIVNLFDSETTGFDKGQIIGGLIYWIIHFLAMFFAFKYGLKLSKK